MPMKTIEDQLPPKQFYTYSQNLILSGVLLLLPSARPVLFIDKLELPVSDHYRDAITALTAK